MEKDQIWKEIIEKLFKEFCEFLLPDLTTTIDFEKGVEFLDQEFAQLFPESEETERRVDKLVKVYRHDGEEQWILIHVEVQGYYEKTFSERMFVYYYRIFDRFKQRIMTFVIFTDPHKNFHPKEYQTAFYGTKVYFQYETYKVLEQDESELLASDNPFALVILATKYALNFKDVEEQKLRFKLKLTRILFERGYSKTTIRSLFRFIDVLLTLTDEMKTKLFYQEVKKIKGGQVMEIMGDYEEYVFNKGIREGVNQGIQQGIQQGMSQVSQRELKMVFEDILEVLETRFEIVPLDIIETLKGIQEIRLLKPLIKQAVKVESLDAFREVLKKCLP